MRKPLLIYGAGGLGREVMSLIKALGDHWDPIGFIDDTIAKNTTVGGLQVVGGRESLNAFENGISVALAIGDPKLKRSIAEKIVGRIEFATLIHPSAILQDPDSISIGQGAIITAGCILTCNIRLGDHVLVNINSTIGHDVSVGRCSSIMPGVNVAGEVAIGEAILIGSGSNILNRIHIGDEARIGMGSVVIRDVAQGDTVAGVPAKSILR